MLNNLEKSGLDFIHGRPFDRPTENEWKAFSAIIADRISGLGIAVVLCATLLEITDLLASKI